MIGDVVRSLPFQSRRGEAAKISQSAKPKEAAVR
jgi:hypothetical protein